MTFFALLTKEMRLRLRRERTIWIIIAYILFMGLLGWFSLNSSNNAAYSGPGNPALGLSQAGINLYILLSQVQLFLILFITPSFTSTTINGERDRQTYDMLLCSRLSGFSLIAAKLVAGLMNAFLLIAAAAPLFSLVFFFGGVTPLQVLNALIVFLVTAILTATFGLFCSTLFKRPAISTAITYVVGFLWLILPSLIFAIILSSGSGKLAQAYPARARFMFLWNPVTALSSTYPGGNSFSPYTFVFTLGYSGMDSSSFTIGTWNAPLWLLYTLISLLTALALFLLSVWLVRPSVRLGFLRGNSKKSIQTNKLKAAA